MYSTAYRNSAANPLSFLSYPILFPLSSPSTPSPLAEKIAFSSTSEAQAFLTLTERHKGGDRGLPEYTTLPLLLPPHSLLTGKSRLCAFSFFDRALTDALWPYALNAKDTDGEEEAEFASHLCTVLRSVAKQAR